MSKAQEIIKDKVISLSPRLQSLVDKWNSIKEAVQRSQSGIATPDDTMLILKNIEIAKRAEDEFEKSKRSKRTP
jgi:hypothetical protein